MSPISVPYPIIAVFGYNYLGFNPSGKEVRYYCPECEERKGSPDKSGHLFVNLKSYKFHCLRCGYSGRVNRNIKISESRNYDEERDHEISDLIKDMNFINEDEVKYGLKIPLNKVTESAAATEYLLKRGFTYDQMKYYDMRLGTLNQEFGRIIIPNRVDHLVYTDMYSARTYIDQSPKYHNPSDTSKSKIVFNLHRIKSGTPIILVEGALTAVAAGYHAVASLGKQLSRSQASQIIEKNPSVIYVNYDYGAEPESKEACKLLYSLNPNIPIEEVLMKDERDAADLSTEEYVKCLNNSITYRPLLEDICNLI